MTIWELRFKKMRFSTRTPKEMCTNGVQNECFSWFAWTSFARTSSRTSFRFWRRISLNAKCASKPSCRDFLQVASYGDFCHPQLTRDVISKRSFSTSFWPPKSVTFMTPNRCHFWPLKRLPFCHRFWWPFDPLKCLSFYIDPSDR